MTYSAGEAAILTRVKVHASYDADNTSRADWGILNDGGSAYFAIVRPGEAAEIEFISPTVYVIPWNTVIEVWQKYTNEQDTEPALVGHVNEIIGQMQASQRLGLSYVQSSQVSSIAPPMEMWTKDGGVQWLKQEVGIRWREESDPVTYV